MSAPTARLKIELFKSVTRDNEAPHWRILETVMTSDGPRTRVADGYYKDEDDAIIAWQSKIERASR